MDLIEHLEELSMLKFSEDERKEFKADFDKILDFVSEIEKIDIANVETNQKGLKIEEFRTDDGGQSIKREEVLLNAPCAKDGCYVCPLVIE